MDQDLSGSAVVRELHKNQDNNIIILDKQTYAANKLALQQFQQLSRITIFNIDINDNNVLPKLFDFYKPQFIYHLAAETHVDNSINSSKEFINSNILGTYNLIELSRQYLKDEYRFIYISTDEVYGDLKLEDPKFTEQSKYKPSSPYSASKTCGDLLVLSWFRTYKFPGLITHCSNNYGPYQHKEKLIPKTIMNIILQNDIPVYGTGMNVRDWIYVDDHAKGLITVGQKGILGQTYNIGSNCQKTNMDIINTICEIMQKKMELSYDPKSLIKFVNDRPGHDLRYAIDNTKIKELGWKPNMTFKKGLQKTIDWYIKQK